MSNRILPNPTTSKVTKHLRYVKRNGERVLQQMWDVKTFDADTCACIGCTGEWCDVPTEIED